MSTKENMEATENMPATENNKKTKSIVVYTVEEVADILKTSEANVKRQLNSGELKGRKVGKKFWRITQDNLEEYLNNANGNGKGQMKDETKEKISFHAQLRSLKNLPNTIDKMTQNVLKIKEEMLTQEGLEKAATAYRLKTALILKKEKEQRGADMPEDLTPIAEKIFPGILQHMEHDPDTLEQMFLEEINGAQEEQNTNVMAAGATDNQDGATIVQVHINEEEGK